MRGVEGGGLVEGLPVHNFYTDDGDMAMKCPTEVPITDRREKELADLGFVPLVHCKGTDYAAFFSVQSARSRRSYDTDSANANARLSAQLPYIMAVSRFAHYLKAMMRDKIGSFMSRTDAESFLNRWITTLCHTGRYGVAADEGAVSTPRSSCGRCGSSGQTRCVSGRCVSAASLPARRTYRFFAARSRVAGAGEVVWPAVGARLCTSVPVNHLKHQRRVSWQ